MTQEGRNQIRKIIPQLKKEKIDLIFSSDLLRTKETAQIVAKALKLKINFDKRLREQNVGIFNSKPLEKWYSFFKNEKEMFWKRPPKGENRRDVKKRMLDFLKEIDKKYKNRNILIVSHGDPLFILESAVKGLLEKVMIAKGREKSKIKIGEFKKL